MAEQHLTLVVHDEGDGMLWGSVNELPGCFASGADVDELAEAAVEAVRLYLTDGPGASSPDVHPAGSDELARRRLRVARGASAAHRAAVHQIGLVVEA